MHVSFLPTLPSVLYSSSSVCNEAIFLWRPFIPDRQAIPGLAVRPELPVSGSGTATAQPQPDRQGEARRGALRHLLRARVRKKQQQCV